ncbi:hypothetical protein NIES2109_48490 [Nostoc sp. HK-01]|nr:hypothetical protein NIES2109_48490 [Nostoc sp. HK-01]
MYSRIRKPYQNASSSESSSKNPFAPRSFKVPSSEEETLQAQQQPNLQSTRKSGDGFPNVSMFLPRPPAAPPRLQMKLTIGQPGDKYEQEADQVAADAVQQINAQELVEEDKLQRSSIIQRLSGEGGMAATPELEGSIQQAKGSGQPLAKSLREPMEQAFGADFSGVKVHTDTQSDQLNQSIQAKAFTTGKDIFFRQGAYDPGSRGGQELIAHELTHVVQQSSDVGVVQRDGVKKMIGDVEKETRKQQAQKFKNPTKKTLEEFFKQQSADRKTNPQKLQQDQDTKEKLEKHLEKKIKQHSDNDILTKAKDISDALQIIDESSDPSELQKLLAEERPIRKTLQEELENLFSNFNQLGGLEAFQNADEESEIKNLGSEICEIHEIYSELSKARIAAKENVFQEDKRNITSKNKDAKYDKLIKMDKEYRKDESKRLRVGGQDINEQKKPVPYLTPEQREKYKIKAIKQGEETIYVDENNNPVDSTNVTTDIDRRENGRFIFVMSEDGDLYVASEKEESQDGQDFHHSSFLGGKPVAAAGEIAFSSGKVTTITNESGHYMPDAYYTYQALLELKRQGMDINNTRVELKVKLEDGKTGECGVTGEGLFKFYKESGTDPTAQDLWDWLDLAEHQTFLLS